jgi:predicted GNAT family acetyltransferase
MYLIGKRSKIYLVLSSYKILNKDNGPVLKMIYVDLLKRKMGIICKYVYHETPKHGFSKIVIKKVLVHFFHRI